MSVVHVSNWSELLPDDKPSVVGAAARERLIGTPWFSSIGKPSSQDATVDRVDSWASAATIFKNAKAKPTIGTLSAPKIHLLRILDAEKSQAMAKAADAQAADALGLGPNKIRFAHLLPPELGLQDKISVGDYLTEFVRFLYIELYAGDVGPRRCTYFREQLPWFVAGFFPCGWVGDWPVGRLRVF